MSYIKMPTLLVVWAFFLISCADDDLILDVDFRNEEERTVVRKLEVVLPSNSFFMDSIPTTGLSRFMFGRVEDEPYGLVKAAAYFQLNLRTLNADFEAGNPQVSEFVFNLKPNYFYGDPSVPVKFKMYQLEELLEDSKVYFSNSTLALGREIAEAEILVDPSTNNVVSFAIDEVFGKELLEMAANEEPQFASSQAFKQWFKGVAIVAEEGNSIIGFTPLDSTEVSLRYTLAGDLNRVMRFGVDNSRFINFSQEGGIIPENLVGYENFELPDNKLMVHSGLGILARVSIAPVRAALDSIQFIEINRADLVIEGLPEFEENFLRRQPNEFSLPFLTEQNRTTIGIDGQIRSVQRDGNPQDRTGAAQSVLRSGNIYRGQMTSFLQAVNNGLLRDVDFLLLRTPAANFQSTIDRFVVDKNDVKLIIYYTTLRD